MFISGLFLGGFLHNFYWPQRDFHYHSVRETGYEYTSPLLYCEGPSENGKFVKGLNSSLTSYINNATKKNLASDVSVYLRYPQVSDWTVINGSEKYSPASLLKVPVMMVYLSRSEFSPSLLSQKLKYNVEDDNQKTNYKPQQQMQKGQAYTINDLIRRMIIYSDNTAEDILVSNSDKQDFDKVFDEVGVSRLNYSQQEDSMDVQGYSYFFRVLYNSTFLSKQISEEALKLLTQTTFTQGIVAGVPKNITVAHKFGERHFMDTGESQLHDCGIIYFPKNPYLLCIMTRGKSFKNLEAVLKNVSEITYNYTKKQSESDQSGN